jgi:class 3 adenylate cyclase
MLKQWIRSFIPEEYKQSEESYRKARFFVNACFMTSLFSFFYFLVSVFFDMRMPMIGMVHNTVMLALLPSLFYRGLKIIPASNLFILIGSAGLTLTVLYTGGFESGTLVWYIVLPIASLLLADKKSAYFWTFVCYTFVVVLGVMQIIGVPFENQITEQYRIHFNISSMSGIVLMIFLLALIFENTKEDAFAELREKNNVIIAEKKKSDDLLLNILPEDTATELKEKGYVDARHFSLVTVLFTDFKDFSKMAERLTAAELVALINRYYRAFDAIADTHNLEKIKTIGDSYMAVGGLPRENISNPQDVIKAAFDIENFMVSERLRNPETAFEVRMGIHTGPVVAGIVGVKKFAYDIWGDTVNTASRMEKHGEPGRINISEATYNLVKDEFDCSYRGEIEAKNMGKLKMYFVNQALLSVS